MAATLYRTVLTRIGPEVADLLAGGSLILFQDGAPEELAEISVLHTPDAGVSADPPRPGDRVIIGGLTLTVTAVGASAWAKIRDLGHVVFSFTGADTTARPGEIALSPPEDPAALTRALARGTVLALTRSQLT